MPTEELQVAPPKQSLIQIADSLVGIFEILDNAAHEDRAAIEAELERVLSVELADKVDGLVWFMHRCDHDVAGLQELTKDVETRIGVINRRKMRVREMAKCAMQRMGASLIKGKLHSISLRAGSESLNVTDEFALPEKYKDTKVVEVIDKARIKRDLKLGIPVPGAELVRGEEGITVR